MVKVNGHLSEIPAVVSSIRIGTRNEPLLRKLEQLRTIPFKLGQGSAVSEYADDITIMVSDTSEEGTSALF